ncbi:MAG: N-carbamoylputrescine amidase [Verrucomicrobiales bacterium]
MRPVTVGLAQFGSPPGDANMNRAASVDAARGLFRDGANVVVLPELCVPWYSSARGELESVAETLEGATVDAWTSIAAANSGIVVGGLCERDGDDLFNTAVAVDETGVIAHYRKLHLFASEKTCFSPGDRGLPVVATPFGRLGLCICYDLRFVEVVRILALSDAEVICVPTAWLPGFDAAKWDSDGLCPQAHGALFQSNLNQVFVACASQVGTFDGVEFLGSSLVADPFGKRIAGPLSGTEDRSEVVSLDLDETVRAQDRGALIQPREDRRTDVYGITYKGSHL